MEVLDKYIVFLVKVVVFNMKGVLVLLLVVVAPLVVAQTCDDISDLSGVYEITSFDQNLGGPAKEGTTYRAHCVALADYPTDRVELLPDGLIPFDKHLAGKLHCRYDAGLLQLAIMSNTAGGPVALLNGKWYEGGWERCYETAHRRCYHGLIDMKPLEDTGGEWKGTYKCDDDDESFTGSIDANQIALRRVGDLQAPECRSEAQATECGIVHAVSSNTIRGKWLSVADQETEWSVCVDTIDFTDFDLDFRSSSTGGVYETGLVHFSQTDAQLLVDYRIGSGCYRTCGGSDKPTGTSVLALLATNHLLDIYDAVGDGGDQHSLSTWALTGDDPTECRRLEALDTNPDVSCTGTPAVVPDQQVVETDVTPPPPPTGKDEQDNNTPSASDSKDESSSPLPPSTPVDSPKHHRSSSTSDASTLLAPMVTTVVFTMSVAMVLL